MEASRAEETLSRKQTRALNGGLERRLAGYVAAAGTAGVGLLALAQPAKADIVYTPVNLPIPHDGSFIGIDLNHDGINDVSLWIRSYADFGPTYIDLFLTGAKGNRVVGQDSFAARLPAGAVIGPKQKFARIPQTFGIALIALEEFYTSGSQQTSFCAGPWAQPAKNGYLGLVFSISGRAHFGWARLSATCGGEVTATLTGFAYDTVANQPLFAGQKNVGSTDAATATPEPGTLGLLALGSLGLGFWRRRSKPATDNS